jgi:hypothetical protein
MTLLARSEAAKDVETTVTLCLRAEGVFVVVGAAERKICGSEQRLSTIKRLIIRAPMARRRPGTAFPTGATCPTPAKTMPEHAALAVPRRRRAMRKPSIVAAAVIALALIGPPAAYAQTQEPAAPDTSVSDTSSESGGGSAPEPKSDTDEESGDSSDGQAADQPDNGPADTSGDSVAPTPPPNTPPNTPPQNNPPPAVTTVYYKNCQEVRNAGKAPIFKGQPGYRNELDRDKDGKACDTTIDETPTPPPTSSTSAGPTVEPTTAGPTRIEDYPVGGPNDGSSRFTSCRQFDSWRAAQAFYLEDVRAHAQFDRDGDGIACEEYFNGDGRPKFHGDLDWGHSWWWHRRHTVHRGHDGDDGQDGRDGADGQTIYTTDYVTRYLDEGGDASSAKPGQQVAIYPSGGVDTGNAA